MVNKEEFEERVGKTEDRLDEIEKAMAVIATEFSKFSNTYSEQINEFAKKNKENIDLIAEGMRSMEKELRKKYRI